VEHRGQPTVILVKTVKGYGVPGAGGAGKNTTHQLKKLAVEIEREPNLAPEEITKRQLAAALRQFRDRFELPFNDDQLGDVPVYKPSDDSPEMRYLRDRRNALGGTQPFRNPEFRPSPAPSRKAFEGLYKASAKARSTTPAWVGP